MLAFQDGKLLAQGEVLKDEATAVAKNANYSSAPESKKVEHGGNLIVDRTSICLPMLLISKAGGIVTRDSVPCRWSTCHYDRWFLVDYSRLVDD